MCGRHDPQYTKQSMTQSLQGYFNAPHQFALEASLRRRRLAAFSPATQLPPRNPPSTTTRQRSHHPYGLFNAISSSSRVPASRSRYLSSAGVRTTRASTLARSAAIAVNSACRSSFCKGVTTSTISNERRTATPTYREGSRSSTSQAPNSIPLQVTVVLEISLHRSPA